METPPLYIRTMHQNVLNLSFAVCGPVCAMFCEYGMKHDETGCPICECYTQYDVCEVSDQPFIKGSTSTSGYNIFSFSFIFKCIHTYYCGMLREKKSPKLHVGTIEIIFSSNII